MNAGAQGGCEAAGSAESWVRRVRSARIRSACQEAGGSGLVVIEGFARALQLTPRPTRLGTMATAPSVNAARVRDKMIIRARCRRGLLDYLPAQATTVGTQPGGGGAPGFFFWPSRAVFHTTPPHTHPTKQRGGWGGGGGVGVGGPPPQHSDPPHCRRDSSDDGSAGKGTTP